MLDPIKTIDDATIALVAVLKIIANAKAQAGLTDDELFARFEQHGQGTKDAIAGYLASLGS